MARYSIGNKLKELREKKGLTQHELATALNVDRGTINHWEHETRDLKSQSIIQLAVFFNVSCDEILRGVKPCNYIVNSELGLSDRAIDILKKSYIDEKIALDEKKSIDKTESFSNFVNIFAEEECIWDTSEDIEKFFQDIPTYVQLNRYIYYPKEGLKCLSYHDKKLHLNLQDLEDLHLIRLERSLKKLRDEVIKEIIKKGNSATLFFDPSTNISKNKKE